MKQKLLVCLLAGLVCGATFLRISERFIPFIPSQIKMITAWLILFGCIVGAFLWKGDNDRTRTFWIGVLRYGIAFDLAAFGIHKFFGFQFYAPMGMLDIPFMEISKRWLLWAYFGRSPEFIAVIAIIQIIGALLLLFNRTRLLGVFILLPVMLNIIFLDIFYNIELGVLVHALFLLAGLIYLLMLDYDRLVDFFLKHKPQESINISNAVKFVGRISIIVVPLLLVAIIGVPNKQPEITGKYSVKGTHDAVCSDSVLSVVYIDRGELVFQFNSLSRRVHGEYTFDKQNKTFKSVLHYPARLKGKEFTGKIEKQNDATFRLKGIIGGDSTNVVLEKLPGY